MEEILVDMDVVAVLEGDEEVVLEISPVVVGRGELDCGAVSVGLDIGVIVWSVEGLTNGVSVVYGVLEVD